MRNTEFERIRAALIAAENSGPSPLGMEEIRSAVKADLKRVSTDRQSE